MAKPADRPRPRIVLLEDDSGVRRSLQMLLQGRGFDVRAYGSADSLLAEMHPGAADCLIADYRLGPLDGIDVLEILRARGWAGPAVLITGFGSSKVADRAAKAGFCQVLEKPLNDHVLVPALERLTAERLN